MVVKVLTGFVFFAILELSGRANRSCALQLAWPDALNFIVSKGRRQV